MSWRSAPAATMTAAMDSHKHGTSFSAGPSTGLGNLGNYKGVMLCNRPPDDIPDRTKALPGGGQPPFRSAIAAGASEQLGLHPGKELQERQMQAGSELVKTRGPSAALRRHCQWIKELQQQVQEDQKATADAGAAHEQRKANMQVVFKQQRAAIRKIKAERHTDEIHPRELEAILRPPAKKQSAPAAAAQKPLWAMTEDERDGCEDEEAAELIRFAEGLDFDKFIDDLEFRQHLQVVRDRAKKLQREQDAFKDSLLREFNAPEEDEEDGSQLGSEDKPAARRRRAALEGAGDDRPDWDRSTACTDDVGGSVKELQSVAAKALENNPQLKAVHSKGSVQKLIEKASAGAEDGGAA